MSLVLVFLSTAPRGSRLVTTSRLYTRVLFQTSALHHYLLVETPIRMRLVDANTTPFGLTGWTDGSTQARCEGVHYQSEQVGIKLD